MRKYIWRVKVNLGILQSSFWLTIAKISGSIQRLALHEGTKAVCKNLQLVELAEVYADELSEIEGLLD